MSEPIRFHGHHPACLRPDNCACVAQVAFEANERIRKLETALKILVSEYRAHARVGYPAAETLKLVAAALGQAR